MVPRRNVSAFDAQRGGGRQRDGSGIAEELDGRKVDLRGQADSVKQQLAVSLADLMSEDYQK